MNEATLLPFFGIISTKLETTLELQDKSFIRCLKTLQLMESWEGIVSVSHMHSTRRVWEINEKGFSRIIWDCVAAVTNLSDFLRTKDLSENRDKRIDQV